MMLIELDADALKTLVAFDHHWAAISTIFVFIGLLLDIAAQLFREKSRLERALAFVGTLIIALGVFGEWHFDSAAATGEAALQNLSDQKVAQLNVDAEKLRQANLQLQRTQEKENQEARQKLAQAETQLELLRARVSWRHLNVRKFVGSLKDRPKPTGVTISYLRDDTETWNLANEIFEGLSEAKWPVAFPEPIPPSQSNLFSHVPLIQSAGGNPFGGVSVVTGDEIRIPFWEDKSPGGALVAAFLKSLPGQISGGKAYTEQPVPPGWIRIVVDPRMDR